MENRWIPFAAAAVLIIIAFHLLLMYGIELQQIQKSMLWVTAISFALLLLFTATVIISINMDRRRDAESSLADNLKILDATVNATGDGILVVDVNRKILKVNDLFFKIWNIPPDMRSLSDAREFLSFTKKQLRDFDVYEAWTNSLFETCAIEHYIASLHDGRIIDVFSNPLMDKGSLVGRVWSFRDITIQVNVEHELKKSYEEVKLITEALEYDKVKTEFFANISHEVKTPLNIIIGTLQLIEFGLKMTTLPQAAIRWQNILQL
ncbi:MAG TPA: PAS-domain containing protein [Bacillota bacterium]|nr:PAS-domain containing protein [Bacillota bacterium]